MLKIVVLFLLFCISGCVSEPEIDVFSLSREELMEYYDVSLYPGNPRVVEGFIEARESIEGTIYVVNTWESDSNTAMELNIDDPAQLDEMTVYCLLVDNMTTCDYRDDVLVKYWLIQKKRR